MADGLFAARFSTDQLPERDRKAIWREQFSREVMRLDVEAPVDVPFYSDTLAVMLPGLVVVSGKASPYSASRTRELLADGDDSLVLQMSSCAVLTQFGREVAIGPNNAALASNADVGTVISPRPSRILALALPRAPFAPMLRDPDGIFARSISKETDAMRLLMHHLAALRRPDAAMSPELQRVFVTHAYDLLALALGATRDSAESAKTGGLAAARLRAIKDDILANLHRANLDIVAVAQRNGISPRHIQRLFDATGETYSQYVLKQRLMRAYRMLSSPLQAHLPIGAIAFDVGFVDLSHFNHAFRRAYGMTPSDVRAAARKNGD
jgi:AraC-like DNA-binding protein